LSNWDWDCEEVRAKASRHMTYSEDLNGLIKQIVIERLQQASLSPERKERKLSHQAGIERVKTSRQKSESIRK
jgi:hypothetical protein